MTRPRIAPSTFQELGSDPPKKEPLQTKMRESQAIILFAKAFRYFLMALMLPFYFVFYGIPKRISQIISPPIKRAWIRVQEYKKAFIDRVQSFLNQIVPSRQRIRQLLRLDSVEKYGKRLYTGAREIHQKQKYLLDKGRKLKESYSMRCASKMRSLTSLVRALPQNASKMAKELAEELRQRFGKS